MMNAMVNVETTGRDFDLEAFVSGLLEVGKKDTVSVAQKEKHKNIGVDNGAAALLFAIFGQVTRKNGKQQKNVYRFPINAPHAINALFGDQLDDSNSYLAEATMDADGHEYFRDIEGIHETETRGKVISFQSVSA